MRATILFPGDYFSLNNINDNFASELDAVIATEGLDALLFNYDEYIEGSDLRLSKPAEQCASLLIYRGWMMKPEQYERFYSDLVKLGFDPLTGPVCYEKMHCFPNAAAMFGDQTPRFKVFPVRDGSVEIDADEVNATFDRFMFKDYVKSVKGTRFPAFVDTPVSQEQLDDLVNEFIALRGDLFTGGIVLKEYVDLKRYGKMTNEWREFSFLNGVKIAFARNSNQPASCPKPPDDYLATRNIPVCPFYTVDYAELADGSWTIIEAGDGGVSGLAASDEPARFYELMAEVLERICPVPDGVYAVDYRAFSRETTPDNVRDWLANHSEESALAYCYAYASNEVGELIHEVNDPDNDHASRLHDACESWFDLSNELFEKIEAILSAEESSSPGKGTRQCAAPFMARNGYSDGCGWWVPERNDSAE